MFRCCKAACHHCPRSAGLRAGSSICASATATETAHATWIPPRSPRAVAVRACRGHNHLLQPMVRELVVRNQQQAGILDRRLAHQQRAKLVGGHGVRGRMTKIGLDKPPLQSAADATRDLTLSAVVRAVQEHNGGMRVRRKRRETVLDGLSCPPMRRPIRTVQTNGARRSSGPTSSPRRRRSRGHPSPACGR